MKNNTLASHIQGFIEEHLEVQKGFSRHTVLSYRDTIKILLKFIAEKRQKSVSDLSLPDLDEGMVTDFLDHLEKNRKNSRQTRNNRLACLHSLFRYIADSEPLTFGLCQRILVIPFKRTNISSAIYLERDEVKTIFAAINRKPVDGFRDYVLFSFIYQTGARVQEVISLTAKSLQLEKPFQVRFLGKGRKERICPLWPDTVKMLKALLKMKGINSQAEALIFSNHKGGQLTRQGVRYLLSKYVRTASENCHSLQGKRVHPHTLRHSCAMHMLESGVDINTIRAWLGHSSLETTNRYAQINLEMKRKILEKNVPIIKSRRPWKQNEKLLQWLDSMQENTKINVK